MKFLITRLTLVISIFSIAQLEDITKKIKTNEGNLTAYLHQPKKSPSKKERIPLIIALHGCNQSSKELAESTGWNDLADYYGYYVLYPEQKRVNNFVGCYNWFLPNDIQRGKGEIGSIYEMMHYLIEHFPIDTTQIYLYGVSGGGMMAVNFLASYPDKIKAGAILAGGSFGIISKWSEAFTAMKEPKDTTTEELQRRVVSAYPNYTGSYPKLAVIHGTADKIVAYKNSEILVKQWKTLFDIVNDKDSVIFQGEQVPSISCKTYFDKEQNPVIRFYTVDNWGHYIMVNPGKIPDHGGLVTKHSKDGGFFSTNQLVKDWQLDKKQP
jgi:feruloyl esterase